MNKFCKDYLLLNTKFIRLSLIQSKLICVFLLILFSSFVGNTIHAQVTKTSTGNGDWNTAATWSPSGVPGPSDTVIIAGHDIKVVANASAASVTFSTGNSKLEIGTGFTLNVSGAVTLKNTAATDTKAEIKGEGTLLCGSLVIGAPAVVSASNNKNELTLSNSLVLTVSGAITVNNDVQSSSSYSTPTLSFDKVNVSATSIVFTHSGPGTTGSESKVNIAKDDTTINLTSAVPYVVNYNVSLVSTYIIFDVKEKPQLIFGCINSAPTSLTNSMAGTTSSPTINYDKAIISFTFPAEKTVAAAASYVCSGSSTSITVASSLTNTSYQLRNGTTAIGSPVVGNGGTISLSTGNLTSDTTFNVLATLIASSCPRQMSITPTVTVSNPPTATGVSICPGGSGSLTATNACVSPPIFTGAKNTIVDAKQNSTGDKSWGELDRILENDTQYAKCDVNKSKITDDLYTSKYNFAIPTTATIKGVIVIIGRYSEKASTVQDSKIYLSTSGTGTIVGNNKATTDYWSTTDEVVTYGSSTDSWGNTLTPAIINSDNFGVVIQAKNLNTSTDSKALVNYIQINVVYTIGGNIQWYTSSSGGTAIGTGTSFNPVGVSNSGLANASTAGTTAFYAACSTAPECRTLVNFVINPYPTANAGVALSAICQGATSAAMGGSVGGGATGGIWSGGSGTWANATDPSTAKYTAGLSESGSITLILTTSGGSCGTTAVTKTITVNANPTAPIIGTRTHPDCITATGSVALSGLPAGNWTINPGGYPGNGTTATISGLAVGTHYLTVTNSTGCTSPATTAIVIDPAVVNTWNGTTWSNGGALPTLLQAVVFDGDYNSTSNIDGCTCLVKSGKVVTFNSDHTLKITNEVVVESSGSLTFNNNSSLVQINDAAANSGTITYKRTTPTIRKTDYTYWSSPVTGYALGGIQTGTLYYSYNASIDDWVSQSISTVMDKGVGYIVRGEGTWFDEGNLSITVPFSGQPNNGLVTVSVGGENTTNLIGNPYPSAIDADEFLYQNSTVLGGPLYFWTHSTKIKERDLIAIDPETGETTAGSGPYAYTSNDYAVYNLVGDVNTVPGVELTGSIAAGVSFFAEGRATGGNVTFNNSMRVSGNNTQFFKIRNAKAAKSMQKNRVWLNMSNIQGAFKQALVGYVSDATNDFESRFDAVSFDGNDYIDFYSVNKDKNLTIQGRALPFDETDEVPLGFKVTVEGSFSVAIDKTDGLFVNQDVFLEDKLTNTTVNLKSGNYTFSTAAGTFNDRFVLRYTNKTLGTTSFDKIENKVLVSVKDKKITVNSFAETIEKVSIYDMLGKRIFQQNNVNSYDFSIQNLIATNEILIVKTTLQNGKTVSEKIIY